MEPPFESSPRHAVCEGQMRREWRGALPLQWGAHGCTSRRRAVACVPKFMTHGELRKICPEMGLNHLAFAEDKILC